MSQIDSNLDSKYLGKSLLCKYRKSTAIILNLARQQAAFQLMLLLSFADIELCGIKLRGDQMTKC